MNDDIRREVSKRRTFAIISHPDAGKTTLTEKLLLYGGAIHLAGAVKGKRGGRQATSDWMEMERQRGISITTQRAAVRVRGPAHEPARHARPQRLHRGHLPHAGRRRRGGHAHRQRQGRRAADEQAVPGLPDARHPDLHLHQQDGPPRAARRSSCSTRSSRCSASPARPINWPIGSGPRVPRRLRPRAPRGAALRARGRRRAAWRPSRTCGLDDPDAARQRWASARYEELRDEIELLDAAGDPFDSETFLAGELTPVFFGSAMTNFGLEPFLDGSSSSRRRRARARASAGRIDPDSADFSGFVFKIQANMDPHHRDRIAFVRVCSGRFKRGMEVNHVRTGTSASRMSRTDAVPGAGADHDRRGLRGRHHRLCDPGSLRIGDTLCRGRAVRVRGRPALLARALRAA